MTDPVNYAQITFTELEDGSVQYDIIPHDQTEEGAIVLLNRDGILSIRDEDGEYKAIAGTQEVMIGELITPDFDTDNEFFDLLPEEVQIYEDMVNSVSIVLSRDDDGALVVDVETSDDFTSQFVSAIPKHNIGAETRSLVVEDEIGIGSVSTSPGGVDPADIPPSFKI